jgi:hypothetical protein
MLRRMLSAILPAVTRSSALTPADISFWTRLGHSTSRAEEIARCFPEYWRRKGQPDAERYATHYFDRETGIIPLSYKYPYHPKYASPESLDNNDPLTWCRVNGYDLYSLDEAVKIAAITASHWRRNARIKPFYRKWVELRALEHNPQIKRFHFHTGYSPVKPIFWRRLGHNPAHARRLARCCPEYWFRRSQCSWRWAVAQAIRTLKRFARRYETDKQDFYELAEADSYDIAKRDPIYWFSQKADWDEALRKVIGEAFDSPPERCQRIFDIRDRIRKAGRHAELLRDGAIHVSGPLLRYQPEYERLQNKRKKRATQQGNTSESLPRWGPLELDTNARRKAHCCAVGPAVQGTDILLRILMQSVPKDRWLVFDASGSLLPVIQAIRPQQELHLLNPLDARSSAWNIAADSGSPQQAREMAAVLLPPNEFHDAVITEPARGLLVTIIEALNHKARGKWSLCDLIAAAEPHNLRTVLMSTSATTIAYKALRTDPNARVVANFVCATLQPLKPAAATWRNASRKVSIAEWLQSNSALILSNSLPHQHLLTPLHQVLFRLIVNRLMEPPSVPRQKTWLFLSDLCRIGRLDSLPTLLSQGPTAGVTVALALDDVEILQRHYGVQATGLLARCDNLAFLRITNPATARWASLMLGIAKVQLVYRTQGELSGKTSHGTTITSAERPLVPPTAFQQLPLPREGHGPVGYFKNLGQQPYKGEIDRNRFLQNHWLCEPSAPEPALVPCPEENFLFPEDTAAVLTELGFSRTKTASQHTPHSSATASTRQKPKRKRTAAEHQDTIAFDPNDFPRFDIPTE